MAYAAQLLSTGRLHRSRHIQEALRLRRDTLNFSWYSLMSIRVIMFSSLKRYSANALASSVFPTPVVPKKMNEPIGRFGSCSPARERRTASADSFDGLVLTNDALVELCFQMNQFFAFALQHSANRYARPAADDVGNVVWSYFLLHHGLCALSALQLLLYLVDVILK